MWQNIYRYFTIRLLLPGCAVKQISRTEFDRTYEQFGRNIVNYKDDNVVDDLIMKTADKGVYAVILYSLLLLSVFI